MLRFAHTEFLWGLVLVPLITILFLVVRRWKRKALAALGDREVVLRIIPEVSFSRPLIKFTLVMAAYALVVISLGDPQIGTNTEDTQTKGANLMILLDVSNSMLSQDFAPNRLENAKLGLDQLISNLEDNRVGIVVFAGKAYVQLPSTPDYSAAKLFLNTINTGIVPVQGTAIGAAIDMGLKSFDFNDGTSKAIILLTDGENFEDDAVKSAEIAHDRGVTTHVIGFGSPQGAPVPIYDNSKLIGFHIDSAGHKVISKLNETMCRQISTAGHGIYVRATNTNSGMGLVMNQVNKMKQKSYSSKQFKTFEDRFQFFLAAAFVLLIAEFFVSTRKSLVLSRFKLFEVKKP
jgi:Ca-activated chloride channel family protein